MTVYKALFDQAEAAAELACALLQRQGGARRPGQWRDRQRHEAVPSILLEPVAVNKDNIQDTIVADEFWPVRRALRRPVRLGLRGGGHPVRNSGAEPGGARARRRACPRGVRKEPSEDGREHTRACARRDQQELRPRAGAERRGLRVQRGEVVALVGDNGAGKSTLVKTIAGIHSCRRGADPVRGERGANQRTDGRGSPRDRDGLPGPRAVRQPRCGREPLPGP